jgi:acyl-CoA synthetase (AMP-forming)/AMP-acid ligase II
MNPLIIAKTMAKRGMLNPGPPVAQVKQLTALKKWGFGLAGELRQAANRSPETVAVIDETRGETTYAQLLANSEKIAVILREMGFGPGDRIGLLARNHVQAIEVMTATSAVGIDLVLGNTGLAGPQLAVVLEQQGVKALIHDDEFAEVVAHLPESMPKVTETELASRVAQTARPDSLPVPAKGGRTVILTSGTTGTPKGAARKTPGGFGPLISIIDRIPLRAHDRILISAPIFHTWGYAAMQLSMALRATIILQRRFKPEAARAALDELLASMDPGECVVIATHGVTGRSLVAELVGLDQSTAWRVLGGFGNCHWASLEEGRAGWRITQWNASAEGL